MVETGQKLQVEQETNVANQLEAEAKAQPTVEELLEKIDAQTKEGVRKEQVILKRTEERDAARKRGTSKEEFEALSKKIDDMQDWNAMVMDDLASRVSGEEMSTPVRKTYRQQLDEKKKEVKPETPVNPDVQKFIGYLNNQGLAYDDTLVQEAVAEDRTPQEALKYLRGKIEETSQTTIDKKIVEGIRIGLEQQLKERGLTASGAGEPSGSGGRSFTQKQINDMSIEEFKENKEAITEAQRQGRIK